MIVSIWAKLFVSLKLLAYVVPRKKNVEISKIAVHKTKTREFNMQIALKNSFVAQKVCCQALRKKSLNFQIHNILHKMRAITNLDFQLEPLLDLWLK